MCRLACASRIEVTEMQPHLEVGQRLSATVHYYMHQQLQDAQALRYSDLLQYSTAEAGDLILSPSSDLIEQHSNTVPR